MNSTILNFALCLVESYSVFIFYKNLFEPKYCAKVQTIKIISIIIICSFLMYLVSDIHYVFKCALFITVHLTSLNILFKGRLYIKSSFLLFLIYVFYIVDIIIGNLFSIVFDKNFIKIFYEGFIIRSFICVVIKLTDILIFYYLYKMFKKIAAVIRKKEWILFNIISAVFLFVSLVFISVFPSDLVFNAALSYILFFISILFLIMSLIVVYFFTENLNYCRIENKMYYIESNYLALERHLTLQNQMSSNLKKISHDMKNLIGNAVLMMKKGNYVEAEDLLIQLNDESSKIKIGLSQTSGNSTVDAIVCYKLEICRQRNINVSYTLEQLPEIKIKSFEMTSLLSNLFDNAIEASEKSENPIIEFKIFMYKKFLTINFKNSYSKEIKTKNNKLISSKESDFHGFGINIISEIAEKNFGTYTYSYDDSFFYSNVILQM